MMIGNCIRRYATSSSSSSSAAAAAASFISTTEKYLYSWGTSWSGSLGLGNVTDQIVSLYASHQGQEQRPKQVIVSMSAGGFHSVISVEEPNGDYNTYAFGRNSERQLGIDTHDHQHDMVYDPTPIPSLRGKKIIHISCGPNYTIVVDQNNNIYSFGMNDMGQCGIKVDSNNRVVSKPTKLDFGTNHLGLGKIEQIDSGWGHSIFTTDKNEMFVWGSNLHGQCGIGTKGRDIVTLRQIDIGASVAKIHSISCASCASVAVVERTNRDNDTLIWGSCGDGKLGGEQTQDQLIPTVMSNLPKSIISASFGTDHCIAIDKNKSNDRSSTTLYGWGFGQHGTLGKSLKVFKTPEILTSLTDEIAADINNNNRYEIDNIQCSIDTSFAITKNN
ncbi:regulator of chromosome condensation domain-containing protein [Cavenderia fasciculata]|uniref:Regulator of chromosome condensation domain-containing protein n=1 Tax=Cavenderia fasciculata TaxID=261658 RepID=F4QCE3_CACFS|nr:regulator of chromosome condensation domain-containing protein [Cavenderia fasciculata]EGG13578.1 regulator of chromosome condensation domain-containing protein [Cavenderia fasciculata]|eukprot:XP_004350282.1 regulator of chromosome condensation domain-containing protein [Cavenderia fasciculata]